MSIPEKLTYDQYMRQLNKSVREIEGKRDAARTEYRDQMSQALMAQARAAHDETEGGIHRGFDGGVGDAILSAGNHLDKAARAGSNYHAYEWQIRNVRSEMEKAGAENDSTVKDMVKEMNAALAEQGA